MHSQSCRSTVKFRRFGCFAVLYCFITCLLAANAAATEPFLFLETLRKYEILWDGSE